MLHEINEMLECRGFYKEVDNLEAVSWNNDVYEDIDILNSSGDMIAS